MDCGAEALGEPELDDATVDTFADAGVNRESDRLQAELWVLLESVLPLVRSRLRVCQLAKPLLKAALT